MAMKDTPGGREHLHGDVLLMLPPKERAEVDAICQDRPENIYEQLHKVIIGCKLRPKIECFHLGHNLLRGCDRARAEIDFSSVM